MDRVVHDPEDLLGTLRRDAAVARRAAITAEATASQARDCAANAKGEAAAARELAERYRRESFARDQEHTAKLSDIRAEVGRHGSKLEEHSVELRSIRASGDTTKLIAKVVTALTTVATVLGAYMAASRPSAEEERKTVSAVVAQTVDGTRDQLRQYVAQTVRELREDDKRKEEAAMIEVRRMLARLEREEAPQRDPDEGIARASQVLGETSVRRDGDGDAGERHGLPTDVGRKIRSPPEE